MRKSAPLPLHATAGVRKSAAWLPLGLLVGLMASALYVQSSIAYAHDAPNASPSDPQAATAPLHHAPMAATPGLTPAQADWRTANQTVAEAAQAAMPGMDHSAHGAGQAAPASQNPQHQMGPAHSGHKGHAGHTGHGGPGHAPSDAPAARDAAAHAHMHGAMHPAGAASHTEAVHSHPKEKSGGKASIPQGGMQHPAGHGNAQHRHGGQP